MFKKVIAILLTSVMVLSGEVISFAEENGSDMTIIRGKHAPVEISGIDLRAPEVCNGKTYYEMKSRGVGRVDLLDGSEFISSGAAYQCSGCYKVMITQYDTLDIKNPPIRIGNYGISNVNYEINQNGAWIVGPDAKGFCNTFTMSGYKFVLSL